MKGLTSLDDKIVLAGRSVYYGALLYAGYLTTNLWLAVAFQAACVTYLLQLLLVRLWGLTSTRFLGVTAALCALTPLGVYTGFLMPDIFAPLAILGAGVLAVYWQRLAKLDRWLVSSLLLFAVLAHSSHLALAASMALLLLALRLISKRWRAVRWAAIGVLAACVTAGLAGEFAFNKAVTAAMGTSPLRLPHPMGRLIDMGPGTDYLKKNCPQAGYAACAYVKNYPTTWDDFLFSTDAARGTFALADPETKRRLSDEQLPFVLAVIKHDFPGVVRGLSIDIARQLTHFGVDIWGYSETSLAMFEGRVPNAVYEGLRRSPPSVINQWLTATTQASVLASLLIAAMYWSRRGKNSSRVPAEAAPPFDADADLAGKLVFIVGAGVVLNAVLCATLASSLDRFQARVIWLIPLMAMGMLARARQAQRTAPGNAVDSRPGTRAVPRVFEPPSAVPLSSAGTSRPTSTDSSLQGIPP